MYCENAVRLIVSPHDETLLNKSRKIVSTFQTPRTICAGNSDDLELVLLHIKSRFPESPIFIFAVSLGG